MRGAYLAPSNKEPSVPGGQHGQTGNFVDGGYLTNIARPLRIWVDFEKLSDAIRRRISESVEEPLDLLRTYYYDCLLWRGDDPTEEENRRYFDTLKFFDALRRIPRFDVREGRLQKFGEQPNGLAVWHLYGPRGTYAEELRQTADDTFHIDEEFLQSVRRERR